VQVSHGPRAVSTRRRKSRGVGGGRRRRRRLSTARRAKTLVKPGQPATDCPR
jgi:hypothetical protein